MDQLKEIGYLDFTEVKRGSSVYFIIHYRRPKLRPAQIPTNPGVDEPDDDIPDDVAEGQQDEQGEMVMLSKEELAILEELRKAKSKK